MINKKTKSWMLARLIHCASGARYKTITFLCYLKRNQKCIVIFRESESSEMPWIYKNLLSRQSHIRNHRNHNLDYNWYNDARFSLSHQYYIWFEFLRNILWFGKEYINILYICIFFIDTSVFFSNFMHPISCITE